MSSKKALRKLIRRQAKPEDFAPWQREVRALKNDRGAGILVATNVEAALERALTNFLFYLDPRMDELFEDNGPLRDFHGKILMGRAVGIYGPKHYENLKLIKLVRNAFAHAHAPVTFKTPEISRACTELTELEVLPPKVYRPRKPRFSQFSARKRFIATCEAIAHNLIIHTMQPFLEVNQNALKNEIGRRPNEDLAFRIRPLP